VAVTRETDVEVDDMDIDDCCSCLTNGLAASLTVGIGSALTDDSICFDEVELELEDEVAIAILRLYSGSSAKNRMQ